MKQFKVITLAALLLIAVVVGSAMAVVLPPQTPETSANSVTTLVKCSGTVLSGTSSVTTNDNNCLNAPPLQSGELYGANAYDYNLMAVSGLTSLTQTVTTNNKNVDVVGDAKNVQAQTQTVFDGVGMAGRATGSEDISTFNAGLATKAVDTFLCPFGDAGNTYNPPFNTQAKAYSSFDVSQINLATQASSVDIAKSADTPLNLAYNVAGTGQGTITAGMNSLSMDAKGTGSSTNNLKWPNSVSSFKNFDTAIGTFDFSKSMSFGSGFAI
jgi:hypothetical protein